MPDESTSSAATRLAQHGVFERCARAGYVVSGVLHLIVGYLAIEIADGRGRRNVDESGALAAVASRQGGVVALWIAAGALLAMSLWRFVETALGRSTEPKSQGATSEIADRGKALSLAVLYLGLAYSAFGFARGSGRSSSQNSGFSARLMESGAGTVALVAGGIVIVAVGAYHVFKGASRSFLGDLSTSSSWVRRLGIIGYIAKGLAIAGVGVVVIVATSLSQPSRATGLDGALRAIGAQPFGAVLLVLAGLGIIVYGLYSFAMARYTKM